MSENNAPPLLCTSPHWGREVLIVAADKCPLCQHAVNCGRVRHRQTVQDFHALSRLSHASLSSICFVSSTQYLKITTLARADNSESGSEFLFDFKLISLHVKEAEIVKLIEDAHNERILQTKPCT